MLTSLLVWAIVGVLGLSTAWDAPYEGSWCQLGEPVYGGALLAIALLGIGAGIWGLTRAVPVLFGRRQDWSFVRAVVLACVLAAMFVVVAVPLNPAFETVPRHELPAEAPARC
jgi:hypothetical protein